MAMETEQTTDGLVIGRNAVAELLAGGRGSYHDQTIKAEGPGGREAVLA